MNPDACLGLVKLALKNPNFRIPHRFFHVWWPILVPACAIFGDILRRMTFLVDHPNLVLGRFYRHVQRLTGAGHVAETTDADDISSSLRLTSHTIDISVFPNNQTTIINLFDSFFFSFGETFHQHRNMWIRKAVGSHKQKILGILTSETPTKAITKETDKGRDTTRGVALC
eukprot:g18953.t1